MTSTSPRPTETPGDGDDDSNDDSNDDNSDSNDDNSDSDDGNSDSDNDNSDPNDNSGSKRRQLWFRLERLKRFGRLEQHQFDQPWFKLYLEPSSQQFD